MTEVVTPAPTDEPAPDAPTGTPIVQDEVSDWGNELTFVEPGATTETGEDVSRETEEVAPADTPATVTPPPVVDVPTAPPVIAPPVTAVPDPGEFTPQDYSFEIAIKGETIKVTTPEQADKLASDPENFDTPAQLLQFMRKTQKMENGIEGDKATWEHSKTAFTEQQEAESQRQERINTISAELNYLTQRGDLPPIASEYQNADWADPLVAAQPGVREQLALLKYMGAENARRETAGLKSKVSAMDAFNGWKIEEAKAQAEADKKNAGQQRRQASARVAGSSAAPVSNRPKGISVGRVGNLNDLSAGWN